MPERLDRVQIALSRGTIEIPWSSCDALLHEIRHLDAAKDIREAFGAVGTSRAVELNREDVAVLVQAIDSWMSGGGGPSQLPLGILGLRRVLLRDLRE